MGSIDFGILARGATEGTFRRHLLPALLVRVARQGRTGRLTLVDGAKVRTIGFSRGLPTIAGSQVASERLGQRLFKLNLVTQKEMAAVDALMVKEGLQFGAAMVRLGIVGTAELRRLLTTHHSWIIAQCLNAREVQSTFVPYASVATDPSSLALLQAIEDGVHAYDELEQRQLVSQAEQWRFTVVDETMAMVQRLGCSLTVSTAIERLRGGPRSLTEIARACDDGAPDVLALSLVLSGLFQAAPIAKEGRVSEATTAAGESWVVERHLAVVEPAAEAAMAGEPEPLASARISPTTALARRAWQWARASRERQVVTAALLASLLVIVLMASRGDGERSADGGALLASASAAGLGEPSAADVVEPPLVARPPPGVEPVADESDAALKRASASKPSEPAPRPAEVGRRAAPKPADVAPKPEHRVEPVRAAARSSPPPNDAVAAGLRECTRLSQSDLRAAAVMCQKVLGLDPRSALAYRQLGIIYSKLGAKPQACESYRRYLRFAANAPDKAPIEALLRTCQ